jgi:hypothetical protein
MTDAATAVDEFAPSPEPRPRHRRRAVVAALASVVVAALVATGIWYDAAVVRGRPMVNPGFDYYVSAPGVVMHQDPFVKGIPGWWEVPYAPDTTIRLVFDMENEGSFDVHLTGLNFPGLACPDGSCAGSLVAQSARITLGTSPAMEDLAPFHPVTIAPGELIMIEFDVTTCATARAHPGGGDTGFDRFDMTYSYGGWSRTVEAPLPTPLYLTGIGRCDSSGRSEGDGP